MSYWNTLPPTKKQEAAIKEYNCVYGVRIHADTKQKAHDVISVFAPEKKLEFTPDGFVNGTSVSYEVINQKLFVENPYNKWVKENILSVKNENGISWVTIKDNKKTLALLSYLAKLQGKMIDEPSCSSLEDSLGYLSEEDLDIESEIYGANPMAFF